MDLKTALTKLKTAKGALPFFFCEADAKGKPVVLVGPVTEDAKTKALAGAKSKRTATGKLSINADGDLEAKAKGPALSVLSKGLTTAALNAGARGLFKNLVLGEAPVKDEETEENQSEQAQKSAASKPTKPNVPAKKFPDVLRKDPAMAALLDQREVLRAQFAEAHKQSGTTKESLKAIAQQIQAIEASLTEAQKKLNATGFTPQPMDAHYEGEDKKMGWNADSLRPGPFVADPNWTEEQLLQAQKVHADTVKRAELFANSDVSLRKNYSDAERANAAMSVDANGNIVDAKGKRVQTKKDSEYVMDAKEGTMHQFSFVPEAGKVVDAPHLPGMKVRQVLRTHHSSVLKGEAVGGAGGMEINDGKLAYIDNASGHYKPGVGPLVQTVETLLKQGALLEKQWVDKDGQPLSGKLADLLMGVVKLHRSLSAKAQADPAADLGKECEKINKAMAMLKKLGAGPSNRIRKDAKVGFLDIKAGMTGIEVKMAKSGVKPNAIPAAEFLQTGGGNKKAAEAKTGMHEELLEKQKQTREALDALAETRAQRKSATSGKNAADPTAQDIDESIAALNESGAPGEQKRGGDATAAEANTSSNARQTAEDQRPETGYTAPSSVKENNADLDDEGPISDDDSDDESDEEESRDESIAPPPQGAAESSDVSRDDSFPQDEGSNYKANVSNPDVDDPL